jgi:DNA-directed RNA polymerase specialized sigma24 family protein
MLRRVEAATKLRACTEALGELRTRLLDCCVLRDLSWREIATLLRVSDKTATVWVVEALMALADWRNGRPTAPPPVLRFRNQPGSL